MPERPQSIIRVLACLSINMFLSFKSLCITPASFIGLTPFSSKRITRSLSKNIFSRVILPSSNNQSFKSMPPFGIFNMETLCRFLLILFSFSFSFVNEKHFLLKCFISSGVNLSGLHLSTSSKKYRS